MTLHVAAVVILFIAGEALVSLFKDFRFSWREWLRPALLSSLVIDAAYAAGASHGAVEPLLAVAFALTLWWLRSRRPDADLVEGLFTGATSGAAASLALSAFKVDARVSLPLLLMMGAAGGMLTFAVPLRLRRSRFALSVAVCAILFYGQRPLATRLGPVAEPHLTTLIAGGIVLLGSLLTISRWPSIRRELTEEARLGIIPEDEVRGIANPFTRFGRAHWADIKARREFVRKATELALRKRLQRRMSQTQARLHQLEVLQLRGLLSEIYAVELAVRRDVIDLQNATPVTSATLAGGNSSRPEMKG